MKPLHIALIIIAGLGVGTVVSLYGNTTKNVTFKLADELAKDNPGKNYVIRCKLNKNKPMEYDPQKDANRLVFYAMDSLGYEKKVVFNKPKPQDMERSDMITITGHSEGGYFQATDIAMKCPSKYEDAPVTSGGDNSANNYNSSGTNGDKNNAGSTPDKKDPIK